MFLLSSYPGKCKFILSKEENDKTYYYFGGPSFLSLFFRKSGLSIRKSTCGTLTQAWKAQWRTRWPPWGPLRSYRALPSETGIGTSWWRPLGSVSWVSLIEYFCDWSVIPWFTSFNWDEVGFGKRYLVRCKRSSSLRCDQGLDLQIF